MKKEGIKDLEKELNGGSGTDDSLKFKSYVNDGKGFDELPAGSEVVGVFVGVRIQIITDTRTKEKKPIRVYSLRDSEGNVHKIGSRALLDGIFDDIMDANGGCFVEANKFTGPGIEYLRNRVVKFARGANKRTRQGDPMGTYEIQVESDD
jgi:hypothetical protein